MRIPFPVEEYKAAVERESTSRARAFLETSEVVCGHPVRQLTLRDVILLDGMASPFIAGKRNPTPEDIVLFLWAMSPGFKPSRFALWKFARSCRHISFFHACEEIMRFVDDALMDAPKGGKRNERLPYFCWAASVVDTFANEYGWAEQQVLDMPLKRLWQYRRAIVMRHDSKASFWNPSMEIRKNWLEKINTN